MHAHDSLVWLQFLCCGRAIELFRIEFYRICRKLFLVIYIFKITANNILQNSIDSVNSSKFNSEKNSIGNTNVAASSLWKMANTLAKLSWKYRFGTSSL